jgi:hypothetical protein
VRFGFGVWAVVFKKSFPCGVRRPLSRLWGCASPVRRFHHSPPAGRGRTYESFPADDQYCQVRRSRRSAISPPGGSGQSGPRSDTAAVGTALGALAGAGDRIGSWTCRQGGGVGRRYRLVAGSAIGAGNAKRRRRFAPGEIRYVTPNAWPLRANRVRGARAWPYPYPPPPGYYDPSW